MQDQRNLVMAYSSRIIGDHEANLERMSAAYRMLLVQHSRQEIPLLWADILVRPESVYSSQFGDDWAGGLE